MRPMVGNRLTVSHMPSPALGAIADDQRLYQCVHLVMANAFKYTRRVSSVLTWSCYCHCLLHVLGKESRELV